MFVASREGISFTRYSLESIGYSYSLTGFQLIEGECFGNKAHTELAVQAEVLKMNFGTFRQWRASTILIGWLDLQT